MKFSISNLFKLRKALLNLGQTPTENGETLVYDAEALEVGAEVYIDGDEGLTPAPDKNYVSDDKIITVEGGKVTSIVEKPIEQPVEEVEEEKVEETVEETVTEETEDKTEEEEVKEEEKTEETEEVVEEMPVDETEEMPEEPSVDELKGIIEEQKAVIEDLKAQIEDLKKQLEEPSAEPAEEAFSSQKPKTVNGIDFSRYIKKNK